VLVNNAAISRAGKPVRSLEDVVKPGRASVASLDEVRAVFETNVFGVIAVTQAMLPLLRKAPAARIVNVSSGAGSLTLNSDQPSLFRLQPDSSSIGSSQGRFELKGSSSKRRRRLDVNMAEHRGTRKS
jgi:NAD(P)-dependent dehydrogenase (short-subunit alcohol dehydrogenase family)